MGKLVLPFSYRELQIIKHSLQHYLARQGVTDVELQQENRLLEKLTDEIEVFKVRNKIK